jgi:hypothetical protein
MNNGHYLEFGGRLVGRLARGAIVVNIIICSCFIIYLLINNSCSVTHHLITD